LTENQEFAASMELAGNVNADGIDFGAMLCLLNEKSMEHLQLLLRHA